MLVYQSFTNTQITETGHQDSETQKTERNQDFVNHTRGSGTTPRPVQSNLPESIRN